MIYLLSILLTAAIIVEAFHGIYHHPRSSVVAHVMP
jgi:hypothetical protein